MKASQILLLTLWFLCKSTNLNAQNEAKIWYFGANIGLDFSTSPPSLLTNGVINADEASATVSDNTGNLLFYTNGLTVFNKSHSVMANGNGILGHGSSTQGALIVKQPGSSTLYYLFTTDAQGYPNGLRYSIIDMSLAAGMGSVTVKNTLLQTPTDEKLAAAKHANGTDIWILSHDLNTNTFRNYLLTAAGLNTTPVFTNIGTNHDNYFLTPSGYLKISPDSKRVAVAISGMNICELYDFNNNTGTLFNHLVLTNNLPQAYGIEFSADGKKLYAAGIGDNRIVQWDLCTHSPTAIVQSQTTVGTASMIIGGMQLAPDGKIYVIEYYKPYLGVISNPQLKGLACNFNLQGLSISPLTTTNTGISNFQDYYFSNGLSLNVTATKDNTVCSGESRTLSVTSAGTYTWNTGESSPSIVITPTSAAIYSVLGISTNSQCLSGSATIVYSLCTSIDKALVPENRFDIFPNPTQNKVFISNLNYEIKTVILINSYGQTALIHQNPNDETLELNLSEMESGLYSLVICTTEGKKYVRKVILNSNTY